MTAPEVTLNDLATEVRQRMDAVDESVSDERLQELIRTSLDTLIEQDPEFIRKIRFGNSPADRPLVGTKYARYGLTVSDVEFLHDLMTSQAGQPRKRGGVHPGPSEELSRTFEAISHARYLPMDKVREIDKSAIDDVFPRLALTEFHGRDRELAANGRWELTGAYQAAIRAMDTAESGYGAQLVGAQYVGELWEAPRALGKIFPLLSSFEMQHPTSYLPVEVDIPEMLYVSESVANNSANYGTVKTGSNRVQVDAKKFVIHQMYSGEMEEDSLIPFVPFLRRQAALSVAHYSDSLVYNGDTTNAGTGNINLDDADPADTKHYLALDGIRHAALVDNTNNATNVGGALTLAKIQAQRGLMVDRTNLVDWGHPVSADDLVHIADTDTADRLALLDEVLTVDKYGAGATVHNGEVARLLGNPLISTIAAPKTEADGKVSTTPANNVKGQLTSFNRRGFAVGWRRRIQVETERLPGSDQTRIVLSLRLGMGRFTPTGAASGIESVATLYNIDN